MNACHQWAEQRGPDATAFGNIWRTHREQKAGSPLLRRKKNVESIGLLLFIRRHLISILLMQRRALNFQLYVEVRCLKSKVNVCMPNFLCMLCWLKMVVSFNYECKFNVLCMYLSEKLYMTSSHAWTLLHVMELTSPQQ